MSVAAQPFALRRHRHSRGRTYDPDAQRKTQFLEMAFPRLECHELPLPIAPKALRVVMRFTCKAPKRPARPYPSRSDLDNMVKFYLDCFVAAKWIADDRHVVELEASKRFGNADEVFVQVWECPNV